MEHHWNYRIIERLQQGTTTYGIHEVYYDNNNQITNWSEPMDAYGESLEELKSDLEAQLKAFDKPVLFETRDESKKLVEK